MKGRSIPYTAEELAFIKSVAQWPRGEALAAFSQKFRRDDVSLQNFNALCKRNGWLTGRTGQFSVGHSTHNKGVPCVEGKGGRHPNSRKTQFSKGHRNGVAVKLWKPIGTERIAKDGYLERKVNDDMPLQGRWRTVQLIEWEAANGPILDGHCLKCLDGNKLNTHPSNWEMIPRAMLPHLNGGRFKTRIAFDEATPELKPALMAVAKIKHRVKCLVDQREPWKVGV